jgi:hypothetical protein
MSTLLSRLSRPASSAAVRRTGAALVASALAGSLAVAGGPADAVASSSPAGHGATWLAHQLNDEGLIYNPNFGGFNDYGLTIDTAFGLHAIGGRPHYVARARRALSHHVDSYTTGIDFGTADIYSGAVAKLAVFAQATGGGARHFGGVNLIHRLNQRVITSGPSKGRIQDYVDPNNSFGADSANVVGQIFAARALLKSGSDKARPVTRFLVQQQCSSGFFRLDFNTDKSAAAQGCTKGDKADTDVTALAVVQLSAAARHNATLRRALKDATGWLKRHQAADGSFGGSGPTAAPNSNSTGVAGWALEIRGRCTAARHAAGWLAKLQVTGDQSGTPLAGERGAIAYDRAALKTARQSGIDDSSRDQWRRATSQAAPALLALSRCG